MSRIVVISPHSDDAVFSVAELMLHRREQGDTLAIACPFMGIPSDPKGRAKHTLLNAEHATACGFLRAEMIDGEWNDDGVEAPLRPTFQQLSDWIANIAQMADELWLPMGIHHPDHVLVASAARSAAIHDLAHRNVWEYEDLPYAVLYPLLAQQALAKFARIERHGYDPKWLHPKQTLCRMYGSQVSADTERCLFVPERLWRLQ